jgi:phosphoribosyl-dephospho-CoA transferase
LQRLKEEISTLREEATLARIRDIDVEDSEEWTKANGFSYIIDEQKLVERKDQ